MQPAAGSDWALRAVGVEGKLGVIVHGDIAHGVLYPTSCHSASLQSRQALGRYRMMYYC